MNPFKIAALSVLVAVVPVARAVDPPSPPSYGIVVKEVMIPLPDGVRLAADLHMPTGGDAAREKFPVLLEYLPYRKTEATREQLLALFVFRAARLRRRARGHPRHGQQRGSARSRTSTRIRSTRTARSRHCLARERSSWSNGNVGMFGISWGGFNSIQMAMRNPPALKAIIAVDATEDLYQEDVHYIDGILHLDSWEMSMDLAARPGAPDFRDRRGVLPRPLRRRAVDAHVQEAAA